MKVIVLYHKQSDHIGLVEEFNRDYKRFKGKELELVELETLRGAQLGQLYGVTQYPAFLAISDNGVLQRMWQGIPLPLMDELDYYTSGQDTHDYSGAASHKMIVIQPLTT